jgi:hypothetical protein
MDDNVLYGAVRAELGKVENITDIGDADILREAGYILQKISAALPKKVPRYITSVANQREYDVNLATIRVQALISNEEVSADDQMKLGSYLINETQANEDYNFPSLWVIKMMRRRRALPNLRFDFNPIERKLKIDPVPEEDGQRYWYISIESAGWTVSATPTEFEELLITGTVWKCLQIVFLRRSTEGGIMRDGGRVDYPASFLKGYADSAKEEFFETLKLKQMLYGL